MFLKISTLVCKVEGAIKEVWDFEAAFLCNELRNFMNKYQSYPNILRVLSLVRFLGELRKT